MISLDRTYKILVVFALVLLALYYGQAFLAPIVLATLFAIVIMPLSSWLEKFRFNRILSSLTAVLVLLIVVVTVGYYCFDQLKDLTKDLPNLEASLIQRMNEIASLLPSAIQPESFSGFEDFKTLLPEDMTWLRGFFGNFLTATGEALTFLFLLPIYIFFIVFYRRRVYEFVQAFDQSTEIELALITSKSQGVVQNYLSGMGIVILIIAFLASLGLWLMDIPYALLLGIISAILTIIPYIGTFIGALIPILLALVLKDSLWYAAGVAIMFTAIQLLENNVITPIVVGRSVNINPLAAVVILIFAGQLWGFIGVIIAIPLAGMLEILLEHVPGAEPWSKLMKN